jgi:hypothetical protein
VYGDPSDSRIGCPEEERRPVLSTGRPVICSARVWRDEAGASSRQTMAVVSYDLQKVRSRCRCFAVFQPES